MEFNLEQIALIVNIVGGIAIIISLIFVGLQYINRKLKKLIPTTYNRISKPEFLVVFQLYYYELPTLGNRSIDEIDGTTNE